jgi:hypothetical protein
MVESPASPLQPTPGLGGLAVASVLIWIFILPITQPPYQRRYAVEQAFRQGRFADALDTMSSYQRTDFPPRWNPPPKVELRWLRLGDSQQVLQTWAEMRKKPPARGFETFTSKTPDSLASRREISVEREKEPMLWETLESLPETPRLLAEFRGDPRICSASRSCFWSTLRRVDFRQKSLCDSGKK